MESVEEDGFKNLGIVEYDDLLQGHNKKGLKEEYLQKTVERGEVLKKENEEDHK